MVKMGKRPTGAKKTGCYQNSLIEIQRMTKTEIIFLNFDKSGLELDFGDVLSYPRFLPYMADFTHIW